MADTKLLTVHDVASKLQVCEETIRRWVREDRLPSIRVGRLIRFDPKAIEEWIEVRSEAA